MLLKRQLSELRAACSAIDEEWRSSRFEIEEFPSIVMRRTTDLDLECFGDLAVLVATVRDDDDLARIQIPSTFSDLYLRLYDNGRFWVEVLNWWGSHINIHDHDFSGVQFQIRGRSLDVQYDFKPNMHVGGVSFGTTAVVDASLWQEGNRSTVLPGRVAPHNVCHLDRPTVSLLIRTYPRANLGPQWNYFPPLIASSYGVADINYRKELQALRLLSTLDASEFHRAVIEFSRQSPESFILFLLIKMIDIIFSPPHVPLLHELASQGEIRAALIHAAAMFKMTELAKVLLVAVEMEQDRLTLAAMGTTFDLEGFQKVLGLITPNVPKEPSNAISGLLGRATGAARTQIETISEFIGLPVSRRN